MKEWILLKVPFIDGITQGEFIEAKDVRHAEYKAERFSHQWQSAVMIVRWHRTVQKPKGT